MRITWPRTSLAIVLFLFGAGATAAETLFEKLVMPGEVIEGHQKLEKDCKSCHASFSKDAQSELCRDCHKPVGADLTQKTGFHGREPSVAARACRTCHTDHKGRTADIVGLDAQTFRHDVTDFPLKGAHATAPCNSCHEAAKPHRTAPHECVSCHKSSEPHAGRLGKNCESCHGVGAWLPAKSFDHDKTAFAIKGAHKDVPCTACHANEQWKGIDTTCSACHVLKDIHRGRFGEKCDSCHTPEKWTLVRFDHDKSTKFPLKGAHGKVLCESCHKGDLYRDKLQTACVQCHRTDDAHKGQLGQACANCHTEAGWRAQVEIDHDLTRFPLIGLHAAVPCEGCHASQNFKSAPSACHDCHRDSHHEGRLGSRCETCHNPNGFELWRFDHARSARFPLTGRHAVVRCEACHSEKSPASLKLSQECASCHSNDDVHRGAFGRACETCHSTAAFGEARRRR